MANHKILNSINIYQYKSGKWVVEVTANGNFVYIVTFNSSFEAFEAREKIEKEYFSDLKYNNEMEIEHPTMSK
jgi:hypothetical protein